MTWKAVKNSMRDDGYFVVIDGPQTYYKGLIDADGHPIPELAPAVLPGQLTREDAYLVSAAPELLAALKEAVAYAYDKRGALWDEARKAIAKAEGR